MSPRELNRRTALQGAVVAFAGAIGGYLVAHNSAAAKAKRGTTAANAYGADTKQTGRRLATLSEIPVGGGLIVDSPPVVVVRSAADQVHAFSAICTHQGCTVDKITNGRIQCPCHGSSFDAATGAVTGGPAPRPLPSIAVTVENGTVYTS